MEIKQIKEMLSNPDVRQVIEEQISKAVEDKQKALESEKAALNESKKSAEKELFLLRKTILAKSSLYESKLKEYYEAKFAEAKKKLGKEVYAFINEAVKNLTATIEEETKNSSPTAKLQEAFSTAVRAMAPYMNVNELVESNQSKIDELTNKLNKVIKQNRMLESKSLVGDLHTLVVSECSGYPLDKMTLLYETVIKMDPKSLTEGKEALEAAKEALREKEAELVEKLTESKKVVENKDRTKLKVVAENIKTKKEDAKVLEESTKKTSSALEYEIYLG